MAMGSNEYDYGTALGRREWLNRDPSGAQDGPNLFAFCHNGPVNGIDAWGLEWSPWPADLAEIYMKRYSVDVLSAAQDDLIDNIENSDFVLRAGSTYVPSDEAGPMFDLATTLGENILEPGPAIHATLQLAGRVPGPVGTLAIAADAGVSLGEGDWSGAARSAAALAAGVRVPGRGGPVVEVRTVATDLKIGFSAANNALQHGGDVHWQRLQQIALAMERKGWRDVRINRQQVDVAGKVVGRNRPDISGINPRTGQRHNIEIDRNPSSSAGHRTIVNANDPTAKNTYIVPRPQP